MPKNKLQDYKFVFSDNQIKIKSYKNRVSAMGEANRMRKRLNKYSVKIFELKGNIETEIKEIKNIK